SAAVVILDFVANWLLKKLASAAKKVGGKLKGMADKFKAKRKAKKDAKAAKKAKQKGHDDHDHKHKDKDKHDDKNKHNSDKENQRRDQADVRRAAKQAAAKGWSKVKAEAGRTVLSKAAAERALASAEGIHNGIKVKVDVAIQGKTWSIKATATKKG